MNIELGNVMRAKIIRAIQGQLSDGKWENSPAMEKYWRHFEVEGTTLIIENAGGFYGKSEEWIKNWFAGKIKAVVQDEIGYSSKSMEWKRECVEISQFISYSNDITVSHCYECYDWLKGRSGHMYGFQFEENNPSYKEFKNVVQRQIDEFSDKHIFNEIEEYNNWKESVIELFMSKYKDLIKECSDTNAFKEYIDNITSEKYHLMWPDIATSAVILAKSLNKESQFFIEITQRNNYSMTPNDCFRAAYFDKSEGLRMEIYNSIRKKYSTT